MFNKIFNFLDKLCYWVSAGLIGGMVIIIFMQVITRMMNISLPWTTEITQYMFVWATFIAGYLGARKGMHIGVEVITNMLPEKVRRVVMFISWSLASFFYGLVLYYCVKLWPKLGMQTTPILKWKMNWVYSGMMFGLLCLSAYFLYYATCQLIQKKREAA